MMTRLRTALLAATVVLLAACSTTAPRPDARAPEPPTSSTSKPEPAVPVVPTPHHEPAPPPAPVDTWTRLREQFAMADCPAPAVRRAKLETRNPQAFEARLHAVVPRIDYIRRMAQSKNVAGEFALLPWVESHYRDITPRRGRPAGMWQIMPITARSLKLPVSRNYDGRLDMIASSEAALQLIADYHAHWKDWRVADMAYNTGEFRMRHIVKKHGMPAASPTIPELPVGRTTRQHLTRLLAISCIIRDPARFHVSLPALEPQRRLDEVELMSPASIEHVARLSGISSQALRKLNPGYRRGPITAATSMRVLLPVPAARRLESAMGNGDLEDPDELARIRDAASSYTVSPGDSLWSIAQRFDVHVEELQAWNDLQDSTLQPGQVLTLEPGPSS